MNIKRIISIFSCILGLIILIVGIFGVGLYISGAFKDRALLFWAIPLLFSSIPLLVVGLFLMIVGYKSLKGNEIAYKITIWAVTICLLLILIVVIVFSLRYNQLEEEWQENDAQKNISDYLNGQKQIIESIDIINNNSDGFTVLLKTQGNISGEYLLSISIGEGSTELFTISHEIHFSQGIQEVDQEISFSKLFEKCVSDKTISYVCANNAGTSGTSLEVKAKLKLILDDGQRIDNLDYNLEISEAEIKFKVDTFTQNNTVMVTRFTKV